MKRATIAVAILMVVGLLSGSGAAQGIEPRHEEHIYNGSRGGGGTDETNLEELVFSSSKGERFVLVSVDDIHNPDDAVSLTINQDADGNGTAEYSYELCGTSDKPLQIEGGADINVTVAMTACDGVVGATRGSVEMLYFGSKKQITRWQASKPTTIDTATFTGKKRTAEALYHAGGVGASNVDVTPTLLHTGDAEAIGGASFMALADETFVSLDITDRSGLQTRASIYLVDSSGVPEFVTTVCGKTPEPLHVLPGIEVAVQTSTGACPDGSPAVATDGIITATFYAP